MKIILYALMESGCKRWMVEGSIFRGAAATQWQSALSQKHESPRHARASESGQPLLSLRHSHQIGGILKKSQLIRAGSVHNRSI